LAHQSQDVFALWMAWELESAQIQDVPYWAVVWPAAQLLAKFISHQPKTVQNKRILDFGCGGGVAGLAALKAGAKSVIANDIDPIALSVAALNARANGIELQLQNQNLLESPPESEIDLILIGDLFYDRTISAITLKWLEQARKQGIQVLIADAARPFAPKQDIEILQEEIFPANLDLEGRSERLVRLLAFQP
jgi:predicted nicotinamide N-methyase